MGEVYRARDTRLDREVALKVLPADFADDEDRLRRFEREAKTLASLNHPNIAGIHGVDQVGDVCFLALELVPGEDLAARLKHGALPLDETLDVCRQIAEGLEAAHEAGVIHRDLKPANVRVTPEGVVKVLDFGLAKPLHPKTSRDGTTTAEADSVLMTEDGLVLGTPTYMSPEQARGRPVDRRTDVWAFGCVLFECLTGKRAFSGGSFSDVLAAIVGGEPDWSALPKDTPAHLRLLLERTLAKDPRQRLRDLGDARWELESGSTRFAGFEAADPPPGKRPRGARSSVALVLGAALLIAVGASFSEYVFTPAAPPVDTTLQLTKVRRVTHQEEQETHPELSSSGDVLIYTGASTERSDIFSQRVGGARPIVLTDQQTGGGSESALSPDGARIAYVGGAERSGVSIMGATGESPRRLTDFGFSPAWSPDGTQIAFVTATTRNPNGRAGLSQLFVVQAAGGEPREIPVYDAMQPAWSPDGRWIAYWGMDAGGQRDLFMVPAEGGDPVQLTNDVGTDWSPTWMPDGRALLFSSDRAGVMGLWQLTVDPELGASLGEPRSVISGLSGMASHPRLSADASRLAFQVTSMDGFVLRVPLDADGRAVPEGAERVPNSRNFGFPEPSPDGEWMAASVRTPHEDIVLMRADGSERWRLLDDQARDRRPVWLPDGSRVVFFSNRSGSYQIWSCASDGSELRQHTDDSQGQWILPAISPDGTRLMISSIDAQVGLIEDFDANAGLQPVRVLTPPQPAGHNVNVGGWSPDGKWISLAVTGPEQSGLAVLSADGEHYEFLEAGAYSLSWTADSSALLCVRLGVRDGQVFAVDVATGRVTPIYQHPDAVMAAASRDGAWLYVTEMRLGNDVWVADVVPPDAAAADAER